MMTGKKSGFSPSSEPIKEFEAFEALDIDQSKVAAGMIKAGVAALEEFYLVMGTDRPKCEDVVRAILCAAYRVAYKDG